MQQRAASWKQTRGVAAWLVRLREQRWSRVAVAPATPTEPPREPAPDLLSPSADAMSPFAAARVSPAQGTDLAERARFVAMTFAFPEAGMGRAYPARHDPASWPLQMSCQPTRFTLTLRHAALGYRLEFCNRGADTLGPLIIRADLVAGREARDIADTLPPCHYLDSLNAGDTIVLAGELRLPLAAIAPMRLGTAELLVPLIRLVAESSGDTRPALSVSACFAIGLLPLSAGGGIQPFRLDSGPGIWRKLSARRLVGVDHP